MLPSLETLSAARAALTSASQHMRRATGARRRSDHDAVRAEVTDAIVHVQLAAQALQRASQTLHSRLKISPLE